MSVYSFGYNWEGQRFHDGSMLGKNDNTTRMNFAKVTTSLPLISLVAGPLAICANSILLSELSKNKNSESPNLRGQKIDAIAGICRGVVATLQLGPLLALIDVIMSVVNAMLSRKANKEAEQVAKKEAEQRAQEQNRQSQLLLDTADYFTVQDVSELERKDESPIQFLTNDLSLYDEVENEEEYEVTTPLIQK